MISEKSRELYNYMIEIGYSAEFSGLIAKNLNTDFTATRMLGYLAHYANYAKLSDEEVVDEMLAILSDRDSWIKKKQSQEAQQAINEAIMYGLGEDDEE
ncbi:MAG: hypothetical protein MJ131_11225 [Lachnospiraceae bacterium]|nr:hypothetical protein [Lachnospiraceae bacterium]